MKKLFILLSLLGLGILPADAQKAYITGFTGLITVDPANIHTQGNICCGSMVYVAKSFDSSRLYVTHWNNNRLYYINPTNDVITDSMNVHVWDIISDDASDKLFASQQTSNAVYIINPNAKTYDSVAVTEPHMLEKRPGHKEIWATNKNQFSVIDYTNTPTVNSYTITTAGTLNADEVRFSTDGNTAILSSMLAGRVYKIDVNTKAKLDSVTQTNLFGVEVSPDGSVFYTSAPTQKRIYIYNTATMALTDSIVTKREPFTLYVNPYNTSQLWSIEHTNDSLTIFDRNTKAVIDSANIHSSPFFVVFMKVGVPAAVRNIAGKETRTFYPNPVKDILHLQPSAGTVNIYDVTGKLQHSCNNCTSVDVSTWPKGYYILQNKDKEETTSRKFLVE